MQCVAADTRHWIVKKRTDEDGHRVVPVQMVEECKALPPCLGVGMRSRAQTKERQVDASRGPQRGEPARWCRDELRHVLPYAPLEILLHSYHRMKRFQRL